VDVANLGLTRNEIRLTDVELRITCNCMRDSWEGLSITYDIGVIDHPEEQPERK